MDHLTREDVQRYADGELADPAAIETHLGDCARCANAVVSEMQLKHAVSIACGADAANLRTFRPIARPSQSRKLAFAAAAMLIVGLLALLVAAGMARRGAARELADLHTTILASANPVDVLSTDRHTVKPWFEGRLPFSFAIPEFAGTPFRLIGGRVVYARQQPLAYLMIGKGSHRLSLFVTPGALPARGIEGFESLAWSDRGLTFVAVGDVPRSDLDQLQRLFRASS